MTLPSRCCGCGLERSFDPFEHRCPECGEALELLLGVAPPEALEPGFPWLPPGGGVADGMWRYRAVLPHVDAALVERRVFLGEGATPLLRARRLGDEIGCANLWLKDETRNPTGSFKDRGTAVGVAVLAGLGFESVGTVSTGNMARSVAAYAARAGMTASVWVGADTPPDKLAPVAVHGADVRRFTAPYGQIYEASLEWSRAHGVPFVNSDSSLRVEGQKTIALEVAEQLGGAAPDWMIVPTSSGGNLSAIGKGFSEAEAAGWIDRTGRLVAVQSSGCDPIVRGWEADADGPISVESPSTIAGAISNPSPPSGARAIRWLHTTDGTALAVPDDDIEAARRRLATTMGRYVQPASAAPLAALLRMIADGRIGADDTVVLLLTGAGSNAPPPAMELPELRSLANTAGD